MEHENIKPVKPPLGKYDSSYEGICALSQALDKEETTVNITDSFESGSQASVQHGTIRTPSGYVIPVVLKQENGNLSVIRELEITNSIKKHPDYSSSAFSVLTIGFHKSRNSTLGEYLPKKSANLEECSDFIRKRLRSSDSVQSEAAASFIYEKGIKKLVIGLDFLTNTFQDANEIDHQGIAHLDIKPDNILVNRKGNWSIADFGCANYCDRPIQQTGALPYQSPELLRDAKKYHEGEVFSELDKADIWSLGATLRYLETGKYVIAPPLETESLFYSDSEGPKTRIQEAISYLESKLIINNNIKSKEIIDKLTPDSSNLTQKEILSHLTSAMLLPQEKRYTAQELKKIVDKLSPLFSSDNDNFANEMLENVKIAEKTKEEKILPNHEYVNVTPVEVEKALDNAVEALETMWDGDTAETDELLETNFNFDMEAFTSSFFKNLSTTPNSTLTPEEEKEERKIKQEKRQAVYNPFGAN